MKMVLAKRQLTVVLYDMYVCVSVSVDVSVCVCVSACLYVGENWHFEKIS